MCYTYIERVTYSILINTWYYFYLTGVAVEAMYHCSININVKLQLSWTKSDVMNSRLRQEYNKIVTWTLEDHVNYTLPTLMTSTVCLTRTWHNITLLMSLGHAKIEVHPILTSMAQIVKVSPAAKMCYVYIWILLYKYYPQGLLLTRVCL